MACISIIIMVFIIPIIIIITKITIIIIIITKVLPEGFHCQLLQVF